MRKLVLICVLGIVVQLTSGQCFGAYPGACRPVVSASLGPGGKMTICSDDLLIQGPIVVAGKLPFSGTVSLEGALPAAGAGTVNYGCGEPVGILTETPIGLVAGYGFRR